MNYMLCKNKVVDFEKWRAVFDSHARAHKESGLELLYLLRDINDANMVVFLFEVHDLQKAKAFTEAAEAQQAADVSGVIGKTEIMILTD